MTDGRNALTWGMFEPDPRNVLNASEPTQADAYSYNAPVVRDAWAAAQDPQTWQDAAQQYGQGLLAGSVAPGAKGMALDPAAMKVLREMTPGFRAYHGSPHSFDAFDSARIGTGEGAQAYGHGLYLADREATAQSYRDGLSQPTYDGGPYNSADPTHRAAYYVTQLSNGDRKAALARVDQEAAYIDNKIENLTKQYPNVTDPSVLAGVTQPYLDAKANILEMRPLIADPSQRLATVQNPGHMYEVQVNADPAHFLDWDKPLSEQSPHVQQALEKAGMTKPDMRVEQLSNGSWAASFPGDRTRVFSKQSEADAFAGHFGPNPTGAQIHEARLPGKGDPARVSEALKAAGIPGIRYLDGGSRADGAGTSNHVIFDANTIAILRKYGIAGLIAGGGAAAAGKEQQ